MFCFWLAVVRWQRTIVCCDGLQWCIDGLCFEEDHLPACWRCQKHQSPLYPLAFLHYSHLPRGHSIQVLRNGFFWKLDTHAPLSNANNVDPYICVALFSRKSDTLPPPTALCKTWMAPCLWHWWNRCIFHGQTKSSPVVALSFNAYISICLVLKIGYISF